MYRMTIEELIAELEKIKEEHGNIEVRVQYRDEGGDYCGTDDEIKLEIDTEWEKEILVL